MRLRILPFLLLSWYAAAALAAGPAPKHRPAGHEVRAKHHAVHRQADLVGKKRKGAASYYGRKFAGKPMASGAPMNPDSNAAASKTLPIGTKAKVKNLDTGKSAVVKIKDRGPYVKGRIVDLTPKTAKKIGMKKEGVAPVEVTPIEVPNPDAAAKPEPAGPDTQQDRSAQ